MKEGWSKIIFVNNIIIYVENYKENKIFEIIKWLYKIIFKV